MHFLLLIDVAIWIHIRIAFASASSGLRVSTWWGWLFSMVPVWTLHRHWSVPHLHSGSSTLVQLKALHWSWCSCRHCLEHVKALKSSYSLVQFVRVSQKLLWYIVCIQYDCNISQWKVSNSEGKKTLRYLRAAEMYGKPSDIATEKRKTGFLCSKAWESADIVPIWPLSSQVYWTPSAINISIAAIIL